MTILSTVPVPEALDLAAGITLAHANKACTAMLRYCPVWVDESDERSESSDAWYAGHRRKKKNTRIWEE
ncbi:predicted protein [Pyrenophora tritici-repentis Pt-1C-BFP]|uniref:Uncharacterized protein n=1 Tax=Pyrenophora tritici-repentis (strain Pt-1C-BFP) TaxID=426418 RepID=B2VZG0_PYRTR|nr:uncharacterized protein PTRG_02800 [Pyrenophora tritici-repentis Pt-1C-BFP]EDU45323.1 predicted protein [Pyrenophora tritici-repentis Pt-1C-BFP]